MHSMYHPAGMKTANADALGGVIMLAAAAAALV